MPPRGRPTRSAILARFDALREDLDRLGGVPAPDRADEAWDEIWRADVHHSTAIEGNTLSPREVAALLETGEAIGRHDLSEYVEVRAYADAAMWAYGQARSHADPWLSGEKLTLTEIREVHRQVVGPVWLMDPPPGLGTEEGPGAFRRNDIREFPSGMKPPPWTEVPHLMTDWVAVVAAPVPEGRHLLTSLAQLHAGFERIHPFRDGNGRVGRLLLNLLLVRHGHPPLVVRRQQRRRYLAALARADRGDLGPLTELFARAALDSLERFVLPAYASQADLLPLAALETDDLSRAALAQAVRRGRLRAVRRRGSSYSSRAWVDEYKASRRR
ncbi:MAG: Fic family protein [Thermoleophilaceae bacterium]